RLGADAACPRQQRIRSDASGRPHEPIHHHAAATRPRDSTRHGPGRVAGMRIRDFMKRLFAPRPQATGKIAQSPTSAEISVPKARRRLFTKYVALFVAVVCVALLSNGIFDVFFYYQEHKASLIRIQREQAEAAAAKIGQFIKEIESQLGWTT